MASNGVPHRRQRCWTVIACCPKSEVTSTSSVPLRTTSEATLAYPSSRPGAQSVVMLSWGTIIVSTQRSFVRGAGVGRAQVGVRREHAVDLVEGLPARLAGEHLVDRHLRILNVAQRLPEPCLRVHRAAASLGGGFPWCRRKRRNFSWKMATISALLGRGHAIVPAPRPMWSAWRCPSACPGGRICTGTESCLFLDEKDRILRLAVALRRGTGRSRGRSQPQLSPAAPHDPWRHLHAAH